MMRAFAITLILSLQALPPTYVSVHGYVVQDSSGRASRSTKVVLVSSVGDLYVPIKPDDTFEFPKVRPGTYDVYVLTSGVMWTDALTIGLPPVRLTVGVGGITGLRLVPSLRVEVIGTARLEDSQLLPTFSLSLDKESSPFFSDRRFGGSRSVRFDVFPGEYRVTATGIPSGFFVRSITAGDVDLRKQPLVVADGVPTINVTLALSPIVQSPFVQVGGRLTGGDATTYSRTTITMTGRALADVLTSAVDADGRFHFPMALPGTYRLHIYSAQELGAQSISAGVGSADLTNLQIPLQAWNEVTGRVVLEDAGPMPEFISFSLRRQTQSDTPSTTASISSEVLEKIPTARDPWQVINMTPGRLPGLNVGSEPIEEDLAPGIVAVKPVELLGRSARLQSDGRFTVKLPVGERRLHLANNVIRGYVTSAATFGGVDILKAPLTVARGDTAELVFRFKRQ